MTKQLLLSHFCNLLVKLIEAKQTSKSFKYMLYRLIKLYDKKKIKKQFEALHLLESYMSNAQSPHRYRHKVVKAQLRRRHVTFLGAEEATLIYSSHKQNMSKF